MNKDSQLLRRSAALLTEYSSSKNDQHSNDVERDVIPDMIAVQLRGRISRARQECRGTRVSRLSSRRRLGPRCLAEPFLRFYLDTI